MKHKWIYQTILRKAKIKLALLFAFFTFFNACQTTQYTQLEKARVNHAKELLKSDYERSAALQFEGDRDLKNYINKYIQTENDKLDSTKLTEALLKVSQQFNYDPVFLLAVIKTESHFNPNTIGSAGEIGLMQIKPSTAAWICKKGKIPWKGAQALKNPEYNVQVGALYFKYLKKSLKSKSAHYINAYNMGINNLHRLPASSKVSHPYYARVIKNYVDIYQHLEKIKKI